MNVGNVAGAIGVHCCRHDERRSQQIAYLHSNVVLAVSKGWQFHDAGIVDSLVAEHLSEDGMRYGNVETLGAGICDAESNVVNR